MKYALVDGVKSEATRGIHHEKKCVCLECGVAVVAKCGEHREKHWAHVNGEDCWYSKKEMSEWHRHWQDQFDEEWREVPVVNTELNKKHVADVKTEDGLVIEFQRSPISPVEQNAREDFYGYRNMIWIVNGNVSKRDLKRIMDRDSCFQSIRKDRAYRMLKVSRTEEILPPNWVDRKVPVFLDFRTYNNEEIASEKEKVVRHFLLAFFPQKINGFSFAMQMPHEVLIASAKNKSLLTFLQDQMKKLDELQVTPPIQKIFVNQYRSLRRGRRM